MGTGRLPKHTAGRGLTSRLWPPNFKEEERQLEDKRENDEKMSQTRPDRDTLRDGISRTGLWPTVGEIGISQAVSGFGA